MSKKTIYFLSIVAGVTGLIITTQPQKGSLVDMALALAGGSSGPGDSGSGDDGHNDTGGQHGGSGDTGGRDHGDGGYQGSPGMGPSSTSGYGPSVESLAQVDTMTQADIDADLANMQAEANVRAMVEGMVDARTRTKTTDVQVVEGFQQFVTPIVEGPYGESLPTRNALGQITGSWVGIGSIPAGSMATGAVRHQ